MWPDSLAVVGPVNDVADWQRAGQDRACSVPGLIGTVVLSGW